MGGFATANGPRSGVKILDGEFLPAELLDGGAILLLLLLGLCFFGAIFNAAIFLPAREKNPDNHERDDGERGPRDALSETSQEISARPGKKALVVFTDGDDNSSVLNANAAVTRAKKAGIPIYAIAEGEATHSANLKKLLEELSTRTGGTSYEVKKLNDVDQVFQKIALDLQHLYMLTYQPAKSEEVKWRKIEVSLQGGKEYRVRAKEGYFPN